jgi:hypothetical protein
MSPPQSAERVEIPLMRGGNLVSTLTGAFGHSLRETRLTALLGYLVAIAPEPFLGLFGFQGIAQKVSLELRHEDGRSDILIETSRGVGVIEAKVDATDPLEQSSKYPCRWAALLTHYAPRSQIVGKTRYVSWEELAAVLSDLSRGKLSWMRILSADLLKYLREHRMARNPRSVEIYAREINERVTLALFLKAQLYGCTYQPGSPIAEALYFAPHFGHRIANKHPGVAIGISYIARIESVGRATTWSELRDLLQEKRGRVWWRSCKQELNDLRHTWSWHKGEQRIFLLLGEPRLAFNPPVRKERLQGGRGWLSKRFFSFDDLFAAWKK